MQLLEQISISPSEIIPADIDETPLKDEKPRDLALRLASEKARKVYATYCNTPLSLGGEGRGEGGKDSGLNPPHSSPFPEGRGDSCYILAADTVVACGRRVLDKTETAEEARACLTLLSGRRHHVYGGIALLTPSGEIRTRLVDTVVSFKRLSPSELESYLASGQWKGVAGGYAVQGLAGAFVKSLRGSYSNVVGLSLYDTMILLDGNGFFAISP